MNEEKKQKKERKRREKPPVEPKGGDVPEGYYKQSWKDDSGKVGYSILKK